MRWRNTALAAAGLLSATACGTDDVRHPLAPTAGPRLNSTTTAVIFRITAPDSVVPVGGTLRLGSRAESGSLVTVNNSNVVWTSRNPRLATVTASGGLTSGVAEGVTYVVASYAWRGRVSVDSIRLKIGKLATCGALCAAPAGATTSAPAAPVGGGTPTAPATPTVPTTPIAGPTSQPPLSGPFTVSNPETAPAGMPALPRTLLDTRVPAPTGRTIAVSATGNLQAVLDSARLGDVIVLQPGARYTGNFVLRAKPSGSGWIVIRSGAPDALLPAPGTRVTTAHAPQLPKIVTPNADPAIRTEPAARNYRLIGLEIMAASTVSSVSTIVQFGSPRSDQATAASVPSNLVLDRSWVHGQPKMNVRRCVGLNSAASAVIDSRIERCHNDGQDSQAIGGWNGPGPYKIVNNYLADATETIMWGGAVPALQGNIPSDIEIRGNHFNNADYMRIETEWALKNLFETKSGRRILLEGNLFENIWPDAQVGFAISIKSSNEGGGCPTCVTEHVTIRNNVIRRAAGGITIAMDGVGTLPTSHVLVRGNVLTDVGTRPNEIGRLFQILTQVRNITIDQNTGAAPQLIVSADGGPFTGVRITNNVFGRSAFGVKGAGTPTGTATLTRFFPAAVFSGNAMVGAGAADYPAGNFFPTSEGGAPVSAADGRTVGASTSLVATVTAAVLSR